MGKSLAEQIALLPPDEREEALAGLDMELLQYDWSFWGRPEQMVPHDDSYDIWLYLAGRGCVAPWTRIYLPETDDHVAVSELAKLPHLTVLTPEGPEPASAPFLKGVDHLWTVTLDNGSNITVTQEHKFLTPEGWAPLAFLAEGGRISVHPSTTESGDSWATILSIVFSHTGSYYDLTVPKSACYYAEGVLNHNSGKSRAASEWLREEARDTSKGTKRFLIVGRTAADVRDVQVLGDSGILAVSPESERPDFKPSNRELIWPNGNMATLRTADEPEGIRGIQAHASLTDEVAAWRVPAQPHELSAWDQVRIATRLGANPQIVATTTPKRVRVIMDLLEEAKVNDRIIITRGSTFDNTANLAASYLESILGLYEGTSLADQELYGNLLEAVEGAIWNEDMIDPYRVSELPLNLPLRVVGVDPSVSENPNDECGIVVCASTAHPDLYKREAWVLEDASVKGSPDVWARKVVKAARTWGAPVVAEVNQGGALVKNAIHQIDPSITVHMVHAKSGKKLRAEPVTLPYQQGRVHHFGYHTELEEQMILWDPETSKKSPDRVDALVHGLTALLITPPPGFGGGKIRAKSLADRRIPTRTSTGFVFRG